MAAHPHLIPAGDTFLIGGEGSRVLPAMIHRTPGGNYTLRRNDGMKSRDVTRILHNPKRLADAIARILA